MGFGNCKSKKILFSHKQVLKSHDIVSITELLFFSLSVGIIKLGRKSTFDNEIHKQMVPEPEEEEMVPRHYWCELVFPNTTWTMKCVNISSVLNLLNFSLKILIVSDSDSWFNKLLEMHVLKTTQTLSYSSGDQKCKMCQHCCIPSKGRFSALLRF